MTSYPMTFEQESIWLDDCMTCGPSLYLESWVYRLTGPVDRDAVRRAWVGISNRHDALRSSFALEGDRPVQRVRPEPEPPLLATRQCAAAEADTVLHELVSAPLDLTRQAARCTLLETGPEDVFLVIQMHHIVLDDWSLHILEREFEEHYRAHVEGRAIGLEPVPLQPGPYAVRQRSVPRNPAALAYWRRSLAGLPAAAASSVPADAPLPAPRGQGGRERFTIEPGVGRRLRRLCGRLRVTPFIVFAAATALLLSTAADCEDAVLATPISRRGAADLEHTIAPLSELLPLWLRVHPGDSFTDLVFQSRARTHEAIEFSDVSIADLAPRTRRYRLAARELSRTVIVLDDAADGGMELAGLKAERILVFPGTTKFDLCFYFTAAGSSYDCMLDYALDRYRPATARLWIDRMIALLDLVTFDPDASIAATVRHLNSMQT
jgi:hypothetical protein